jgi:hypothetical protein
MKIGFVFNTEPETAAGILDFIFEQKIPVFALCFLGVIPPPNEILSDVTVFECRYFSKADKLGVFSGRTAGLGFDEHICKCRRAGGGGGFKHLKPYQRLKALAICENLLRRFGCTNIMSFLSEPHGFRMPPAPARLSLACGESKESAKSFVAAALDKWLPELVFL